MNGNIKHEINDTEEKLNEYKPHSPDDEISRTHLLSRNNQGKIREKGFTYLTKNVRSKGRENVCQELSMAEYLLPETKMLSIEEKQRLFQVKNKMCQIPSNFPKKDTKYFCFCGNEETMDHIYRCEMLRNGNNKMLEYEKIYTGTISEQIEIFRIFESNMKVRETLKDNIQIPCGLQGDPLSVMSVMGIK